MRKNEQRFHSIFVFALLESLNGKKYYQNFKSLYSGHQKFTKTYPAMAPNVKVFQSENLSPILKIALPFSLDFSVSLSLSTGGE